ncbi:MAG: CDP-diacylglycerol--glycerol-3-phosphate 3-phosphatidyltransferase [Clostridia bacterium]|nr:CDP-diacylglycerol--glycerol-3-phosphate 3-phosphatidyltransferase [Clostridia bacterium]
MNLPNKITLTRIFMIPVFVLFFFLDVVPFHYGIAAIIFALAACTDFIDGYIARKYKLVTNLGKFLDPIADKVLVSTAMILMLVMKDGVFQTLGVAANGVYIATAVCICVIMARELIISAFRQIAAVNGVVMAADKLGKFKTIFQDVAIFVIILAGGIGEITPVEYAVPWDMYALIGGLGLFAIATILTVWSGISYVVKNRKVLKDA